MWCVMHCCDVWVMFCPAPYMGRGRRCFVVGVRWGESVVWCIGFGTLVVDRGRYVVYGVGCDGVCVRGGSLLVAMSSLLSRD